MVQPLWYAVRTNPRCEGRALKSIEAEGFQAYLPVAKKHIVHHRTRVLIPKTYPMLVGYVLASFPTVNHASHARGCDGVKAVLGVGGTPLPLADRDVQGIREAEARLNDLFESQIRQRDAKGFLPGDRVVFRRGAWNGFTATVVDAKSRRAIRVLTEVFGRMTEVAAPVDFLERAA